MNDPLNRLTAALADRHRIEREVGAGGMATVYLAHSGSTAQAIVARVITEPPRPEPVPEPERGHSPPGAGGKSAMRDAPDRLADTRMLT